MLGRILVFVQYRRKASLPPFGRFPCVDEQTRWRRLDKSRAVINQIGVDAPRDSLPASEFELTRRVITRVANDAAAFENWLNLLAVAHQPRGSCRPVVTPRIGLAVLAPKTQGVNSDGESPDEEQK